MVNCKKCVYCIKTNKHDYNIRCKKFKGEVSEANYCIYYKTQKEFAKEQAKKAK